MPDGSTRKLPDVFPLHNTKYLKRTLRQALIILLLNRANTAFQTAQAHIAVDLGPDLSRFSTREAPLTPVPE